MEPIAKKYGIPFTLYDFFGYLLPGLTFCALILLSFDLPKLLDLIQHRMQDACCVPKYYFLTQDLYLLFHESPIFFAVLSILIAYIGGHIIAALSSYLLERLLVNSFLGYPTQNMFQAARARLPWLFHNYRRAYSQYFIETYTAKFKSVFDFPAENPNDMFWVTFEYIGQNCPAAFARAIHFLDLNGFSRNLSMSFLIAATLFPVVEYANSQDIHWTYALSYLFISATFYWNYLKLLRRLNDEVFRAFVAFVK